MILTELQKDNSGNILKWQKVEIQCHKCLTIQRHLYNNICNRIDSNLKWVCRDCKSKIPSRVEYFGPEIESELKRNKQGRLITTQRVLTKCSKCSSITDVDYYGHKRNMLKKLKDNSNYLFECLTCIKSDILRKRNLYNKGKTYEEIYGVEKTKQIKSRLAEIMSCPSRYSKLNEWSKNRTGKSNIEVFGLEKAQKIQKKWQETNKTVIRKKRFGKDNPQFGKPAAEFSGRGYKGYYKRSFFRSLMELSFIVNYLEQNNIEWESGELDIHMIPYMTSEGKLRNYFPDFITETEIIEIKPSRLIDFGNNINKAKAGTEKAKQLNKTYKMYTEKNFKMLTKTDIYKLEQQGLLKFISKGEKI